MLRSHPHPTTFAGGADASHPAAERRKKCSDGGPSERGHLPHPAAFAGEADASHLVSSAGRSRCLSPCRGAAEEMFRQRAIGTRTPPSPSRFRGVADASHLVSSAGRSRCLSPCRGAAEEMFRRRTIGTRTPPSPNHFRRGSRCLSSSLFRGQEQMPLTLPRSGGRNVPTEDHRNEDTSLTQPLSRVEQMHLI
jgi:hypothetical protein